MNISDIIQLVVLCALIFCRLATMHAIPCAVFAIRSDYCSSNLAILNPPEH
ncbi:celllulose biosynthesis operon protein BcsF/YhjT [Enterobacter hormaechei]|nr:celllulose biosynthesis operon protein BcsF/YhjT [Enterobacter hormaechei]